MDLIAHLPLESAFVAAQLPGGPENQGWSVQARLTADLIDWVNYNTYVTILAANPKKKPKPIEPVLRPGDKAKKKSQPNMFAVMAGKHMVKAKRAKEIQHGGSGR